jgi:predicted MFS family arabinose efflux permease
MLAGDVLQMIAIAALASLVAEGALQLWQLAVVAGTTGIGSGLFLASSAALVPELVSEEHFQSANSMRSSGMLVAYDLVGPAAGGVLVAAAGTATAFAVDSATFLASILALTLIRPQRVPLGDQSAGLLSEVREGFRYVKRTPWIWISLLAVGTVGNCAAFGPLPVLIPLFVRDHLDAGADVLGFVFAGYGLGGLAGALTMGSIPVSLRSALPAYLGWGCSALGLGALAFAPNAAVAAVLLAVAGFGGEMAEVVWGTLLQRLVPRQLLGRVTSTDWLVSLSLQPLGVALAAPVAGWLGVGGALLAGSALSTTAIATGAAMPAIRHLERAAQPQEMENGESSPFRH